jgi:hypothetical protein
VKLGSVDLNQTVLAALSDAKIDPGSKGVISNTLNGALTSSLAGAATNAGYANLATLIGAIPSVDIAASKDLSIHDFVSKEVKLPDDPTAKAAAESAIANLSTTTTIGDLLNLNSPINANPIFAGEVKKVGLATLLHTSPALAANAQLIDDFVGRYTGATGSLADFWKILGQDTEFKTLVPELQFTLQLGTLTQDNAPLVAALRSQYPNIHTATQLASVSSAQWQQLITRPNITVPASVPGATPAEKAANYAGSIISTLQEALPGTYFGSGLQGALANSKDPVDHGLTTFLNNASGFDILNTNLNTFIAQNGQALFNGIDPTQQSAVTAQLAAWQRVARVIPDFPTANALVSAGFTSAYDIASTPRASFIQQLSGPLSMDAATIYGRAQQIAASAMTIFSNVRQGLSPVTVRVIGDFGGALNQLLGSSSSVTPASGIPNWQTLFGSLSYCSCSDCRSVLSAAAYFVDLLYTLKKSKYKNSKGYTPLDVLIGSADGKLPGRRPDLPYLKLNCENTNTELPYVDLGHLDATVAHNTPSDATASDLSVSPEYTNDQAYNQYLAAPQTVYPPTLPFDRWLTTARTYLGFLGSSLYQVMAACQTGAVASDITKGKPSTVAIACEYLNISQAECVILTGKDFSGQPIASPPPLYQYYGYSGNTVTPGPTVMITNSALSSNVVTLTAANALVPGDHVVIQGLTNAAVLNGSTLQVTKASGASFTANFTHADIASAPDSGTATGSATPWEQDVAYVETFLRNTAIGYDDLVSLLETWALNPNLSIMLQAPGNALCDLTQTILVDLAPTGPVLQDKPTLALMHRFIRLWKKLGWAIEDLDKTMTALQAKDIDQQFLISLAGVRQLQTALNIPLLQILSFWNNLDTDGRDSLYLSLFQNPAVLNPPDSAFQLLYVAPLTALPTLEFPSPTFPNLTYSTASGGLLSLKGTMSAAEYNFLVTLSADTSYRTAIG